MAKTKEIRLAYLCVGLFLAHFMIFPRGSGLVELFVILMSLFLEVGNSENYSRILGRTYL